MTQRILATTVWCVVLYFAGCVLVGGIAGGVASARLHPGEDARAVGAAAGARAVQTSRSLIGVVAAVISIVGSYFRLLPGSRSDHLKSGLPHELQRWARTRELGRPRYIWLYGVVFWGLTAGLLWSIIMATFQGWNRWPVLFVTAMVVFPIGGYFFGTTMWNKMEAKYEGTIAKESAGPQRNAS